GADVAIVLYVIAEGRYKAENFPQAAIDFSKLSWDWSQSKSDFALKRASALAGGGFLTSFSLQQGMTASVTMTDGNPAIYTLPSSNQSYADLTSLYFGQAAADEFEQDGCAGVSAIIDGLAPGTVVIDCAGDPTCQPPPNSPSIEASSLACNTYSDIAAALTGMHPEDVWVTRLEADLPRSALARDLTLSPADAQKAVDNWHEAQISIGSPCPPPTQAPAAVEEPSRGCGGSCSVRRPVFSNAAVASLAGLALLFVARRASGRRRRRS